MRTIRPYSPYPASTIHCPAAVPVGPMGCPDEGLHLLQRTPAEWDNRFQRCVPPTPKTHTYKIHAHTLYIIHDMCVYYILYCKPGDSVAIRNNK